MPFSLTNGLRSTPLQPLHRSRVDRKPLPCEDYVMHKIFSAHIDGQTQILKKNDLIRLIQIHSRIKVSLVA